MTSLILVLVEACWSLTTSFDIALDTPSVLALQHQFTVLTLPVEQCRDNKDVWHEHCAYGLLHPVECEYLGYQYSMEWTFAQMLLDNPQYLASNANEARFVYFPHCATQVYFALRQTYGMSHWKAIEITELDYLIPLLRWAHGTPLHQQHHGLNF